MTTTDTTHTGTAQVLFDLDEDGVGRLRLNRPEASNGMNVPFLRALHEAVMTATGRPELRVLLLTGEGKNFCAGGDVKTFAAKGEALPDYLREATAWLQNVAQALLALPVPVVAAVHGFAAGGGGLGLVCASDIVLAGESAKFMSGAARVGMAPDAGSSVTLPQLVGLRKAMEILLLNPTLTAAEAAEIGLITRVVADDALHDEALAVARTLAAGAPARVGRASSPVGDAEPVGGPPGPSSRFPLAGLADDRSWRRPRFPGLRAVPRISTFHHAKEPGRGHPGVPAIGAVRLVAGGGPARLSWCRHLRPAGRRVTRRAPQRGRRGGPGASQSDPRVRAASAPRGRGHCSTVRWSSSVVRIGPPSP